MNLNRLLFIIVLLFISASCATKKVAVPFQDLNQAKPQDWVGQATIERNLQPTVLVKGDVLFVSATDNRPLESFELENTVSAAQARAVNPYLMGYPIDSAGLVHLPLVGAVKVAGLTLDAATAAIQSELSKYIQIGELKVYLLNNEVSVLGEVNAPGFFVLNRPEMTIINAIASANGFTEFADLEEIKLIRFQRAAGTYLVKHLNLKDLNSLSSEYFSLMPGDVIVVKPLKRKAYSGRNIQWTISAISTLIAATSLIISVTR